MMEKKGEEILVVGEDVREVLKGRKVSFFIIVYKKFLSEKKGFFVGTGDDILVVSSRGKKCVVFVKMKIFEFSIRRNIFIFTMFVFSIVVSIIARIKKVVVFLDKLEYSFD